MTDGARQNPGHDEFGDDGDDGVLGGLGNDMLFGGDGHDVIQGGDGSDTIFGGAGDDTLSGRQDSTTDGTADHFVFSSGSGQDLINGFEIAYDRIVLEGIAGVDWTYVKNNLSNNGANAVLDLGGGNSITFVGIDFANLDEVNFIFL